MATSMGNTSSAPSGPSTRVQWMWNSNENPFSEFGPWRSYSDVENMMIEEAFLADKPLVEFDDYDIDLKHKVQISKDDSNRQRQIKRIECGKEDKHLREKRFLPNPVAPDHPFRGQYGFISPFVKEVVKHLKLNKDQLPSKNDTIVPKIVEKAAQGIIEEGRKIRKRNEAEYMANLLRAKKESGMKNVWKCCAHLYSLNSFIFKQLNETMRFIGSEQHEQVWRSKIDTLGPFCLLLWDNPFKRKMAKPGTIIYRGAELSDDLIRSFKDDCSKDPRPWHSFQAFTSCTRNRRVAEMYGNVVFIMETRIAFTVNIQPFSKHSDEEEELLFPGVSFTIDRMEFDENNKKHLIHLTLHQRRNRSDQHHLNPNSIQSSQENQPYNDDDVLDAVTDDLDHAAYAARLDHVRALALDVRHDRFVPFDDLDRAYAALDDIFDAARHYEFYTRYYDRDGAADDWDEY